MKSAEQIHVYDHCSIQMANHPTCSSTSTKLLDNRINSWRNIPKEQAIQCTHKSAIAASPRICRGIEYLVGSWFLRAPSNEMDWMSNVQMFLLDNVVGHCFKIESTPSPTTNTKSVCTMKPIKPLLFQGPFPLKTHQSYTSHCLAVSAKWVQGMPSQWQTGQFIHPCHWARWHRIIVTFHW